MGLESRVVMEVRSENDVSHFLLIDGASPDWAQCNHTLRALFFYIADAKINSQWEAVTGTHREHFLC